MPHRTEHRIPWGDTDAGGLIYFPRYFHPFVVGLNAYFEAPGGGHLMESLRRDGRVLPAVDASASFEAPLRAGDDVAIETTIAAGESSLEASFVVARTDDGVRAATGRVVFVLIDGAFESAPLPESVGERIREREGAG
jgi:acyl-CoA thioester hydrolase